MGDDRYPDSKVSEGLLENLKILPDGSCLDLAWVRKNLWAEAATINIPRDSIIRGMQANIYTLNAEASLGADVGNPRRRTFIAKRIVPVELPAKGGGVPAASAAAWSQFLSSVRREADFYRLILLHPDNEAILKLFPTVYHCSSTPAELDDTDPMHSSHLLVMSDLSKEYFQVPSMNRIQAQSLMKGLAAFHAHFWHSSTLEGMERGGFWVLDRRRRQASGELENAPETWQGVLDRFPELKTLGLQNVESIGREMAGRAQELDDFVASKADWTVIHGDAKGWNLFFAKDPGIDQEADVVFIDMQWVGKGHPYQDVAYALTTSLDQDLLDHMGEFVDLYTEALARHLEGVKKIQLPDGFRQDFDLIWLDYARVIVTGLWRNLDPERMKRYETAVGPSMINRSMAHVKFIVKRIHSLLFDPGNIYRVEYV